MRSFTYGLKYSFISINIKKLFYRTFHLMKAAGDSVIGYGFRNAEDFFRQTIEAQLLEKKIVAIKQQKEYAEVVEQAMQDMYPTIKPCEEIKFSPRRTLQSYLMDFSQDEFMEKQTMKM